MKKDELIKIRNTIANEYSVARKKLNSINALQEEVQREVNVRNNLLSSLDALIEMKEE
jgi:hypothetical protein